MSAPTKQHPGKRRRVLFVMQVLSRQLKPGKHKQPVAVLTLREDAPAGSELILTERDLRTLSTMAAMERRLRDNARSSS